MRNKRRQHRDRRKGSGFSGHWLRRNRNSRNRCWRFFVFPTRAIPDGAAHFRLPDNRTPAGEQ
ncbi:MAG: hypothetical protein LBU23_12440, partial [Planctomycetota bacterium]|nr:hypothetical protein [Planctomycetota bacterium]